jgi:hypothetical protein
MKTNFTKDKDIFFHKFKFLKKTFLNFGSNALNTARSPGIAALCLRQKLHFDEIDAAQKQLPDINIVW